MEQDDAPKLDDDSLRFLARIRGAQLLNDAEWEQIDRYQLDAIAFLRGPRQTVTQDADGMLVLDPDADPRNADWLKLGRVHRLTGHVLPGWASLWLWRIGHDKSKAFWREIAEVAGDMGYARWPPREPATDR